MPMYQANAIAGAVLVFVFGMVSMGVIVATTAHKHDAVLCPATVPAQ